MTRDGGRQHLDGRFLQNKRHQYSRFVSQTSLSLSSDPFQWLNKTPQEVPSHACPIVLNRSKLCCRPSPNKRHITHQEVPSQGSKYWHSQLFPTNFVAGHHLNLRSITQQVYWQCQGRSRASFHLSSRSWVELDHTTAAFVVFRGNEEEARQHTFEWKHKHMLSPLFLESQSGILLAPIQVTRFICRRGAWLIVRQLLLLSL